MSRRAAGPPPASARARPRGGGTGSTSRSGPGGRADLEQVFRAGYPRVVAVAARVLGSADEAEDVAQRVFLAFSRTAAPAGQAQRWLAVAAAHTALDRLRSGRHTAPSRRPRVPAALGRLPRREAVALVLRHSGLGYDEIADALDLSPGSVGTTLRRAESALSEQLSRGAPVDRRHTVAGHRSPATDRRGSAAPGRGG